MWNVRRDSYLLSLYWLISNVFGTVICVLNDYVSSLELQMAWRHRASATSGLISPYCQRYEFHITG